MLTVAIIAGINCSAIFIFYQENLARLQRAFARKWEFIFMQAEAQVK